MNRQAASVAFLVLNRKVMHKKYAMSKKFSKTEKINKINVFYQINTTALFIVIFRRSRRATLPKSKMVVRPKIQPRFVVFNADNSFVLDFIRVRPRQFFCACEIRATV
jgi:hypothetical protein